MFDSLFPLDPNGVLGSFGSNMISRLVDSNGVLVWEIGRHYGRCLFYTLASQRFSFESLLTFWVEVEPQVLKQSKI